MGNAASVFLPKEKDEDYIITFIDNTIVCTDNSPTFRLGSAGKLLGKKYTIINSGSGTLTILPVVGQLVDGKVSTTLANGEFLDIRSDGSDWINLNAPTITQVLGYTFATLPASPITGMLAYITDADTISYRAVAVGGGSDTALVFYDGTDWIYH
jgi:hypothetical protein